MGDIKRQQSKWDPKPQQVFELFAKGNIQQGLNSERWHPTAWMDGHDSEWADKIRNLGLAGLGCWAFTSAFLSIVLTGQDPDTAEVTKDENVLEQTINWYVKTIIARTKMVLLPLACQNRG